MAMVEIKSRERPTARLNCTSDVLLRTMITIPSSVDHHALFFNERNLVVDKPNSCVFAKGAQTACIIDAGYATEEAQRSGFCIQTGHLVAHVNPSATCY